MTRALLPSMTTVLLPSMTRVLLPSMTTVLLPSMTGALLPSLSLLLLLPSTLCHEYYDGPCPQFPPLQLLDWTRFTGSWHVGFKHASRSTCIRYEYSGEDERTVEENKLLPVLGRFGIPSAVTSSGRLSQMSSSGAMTVEWDTGLLRQAMFSKMEYVILATDYTTQALVCSCQDLNLGFESVNRRSCDFLMRPGVEVPAVLPKEYTALLDKIDPDLALDMKRVRQDDCRDLQGHGVDVGFLVQAGKTYMDSGLAYIVNMLGK